MAARRPTLSIGQFARRSRLSPKALRLYDRLGVLAPAAVDEHNGYRTYLEDQLGDARLVVSLRRLDMPLHRVAEVVAAPDTGRARLIEAYWAEVEGRVAAQRHLTHHLLTRLTGQEGHQMFQISERDVPEQRMLTEQRHTTVAGLNDFISSSLGRMYGTAAERGLAAGSSVVIYHGEVNEDSDGPVEVCVPISVDGSDVADLATRIEPAHREAYTEITKAQVEFPQILSAYEAVEKWVGEHGRQIIGSPREVYVDDFMNLGPDDHGCDIAFPIASS